MSGRLIQVTGLPRCGTAFASAFLSMNPGCLGVHELAASNDRWREELDLLLESWESVADCSTYAFLPKARRPADVRVLLRHPHGLSEHKSRQAFGWKIADGAMKEIEAHSLEWAETEKAVVIESHELFTVQGLVLLWSVAFPGTPIPRMEKIERLLLLEITRRNGREVFDMTGKNPNIF